MHFEMVDRVLESSDQHIVTIKNVTAAEEYLRDHFEGFPVLPGVFMVEAMVQAARRLLAPLARGRRLVLGGVRAVKYGSFVRPGESLRVEVRLLKRLEGDEFELRGEGVVLRIGAGELDPSPTAVSGRLTMRPVRASVA